jgi:hypothetical protein
MTQKYVFDALANVLVKSWRPQDRCTYILESRVGISGLTATAKEGSLPVTHIEYSPWVHEIEQVPDFSTSGESGLLLDGPFLIDAPADFMAESDWQKKERRSSPPPSA